MLTLSACAAIDPAVQTALDLIAVNDRKEAWGRQTNSIKAFKKAVKDHGMHVQKGKCVWCEAKVGHRGRRSAHRDHVAPKDLYPHWTFEAKNIILSCEYCNGFQVKKALDTIKVRAADYSKCKFWIVHPYLDDPERHIGFIMKKDRVVIKGLSQKGIWTVRELRLQSATATAARALDIVIDRAKLSAQDLSLIRQAMEAL